MTVDNFVGSLVEMAKAYERMPAVEAELRKTQDYAGTLADTVAAREETILRLKAEIEALHAKQRELEVSRDDAQFHALEADDRTQRALDFIKATFGNAGALIQALEPPKAEPTVANVPVQAVPEASAAPEGVTNPDETSPKPYLEQTSEGVPFRSIYDPNTATQPAPEVAAQPGEPASDAITPTAETPKVSATDTANQEASAIGDPPTVDPSQKPTGPYTGRTYSSVVASGHWPTRDQWEAGGGTVDNWFA